MTDYYKVLGVDVDAPEEVIKAAYKAMAKKYHPDTYKGERMYAEKKMKELNEAVEALMNEEYRSSFAKQAKKDETRDEAREAAPSYAEPQSDEEKELTPLERAIGRIFSVIICIAIIGFIVFAGYHVFEMIKGFMFP